MPLSISIPNAASKNADGPQRRLERHPATAMSIAFVENPVSPLAALSYRANVQAKALSENKVALSLEKLPWELRALIFEQLDTRSLIAATRDKTHALTLPAGLAPIAERMCQARYSRLKANPPYPHRPLKAGGDPAPWSLLLSEQETLLKFFPRPSRARTDGIGGPNIERLILDLLPLWETANPTALTSILNRLEKRKLGQEDLSRLGQEALLVLSATHSSTFEESVELFLSGLALAQMRREDEALEAFDRSLKFFPSAPDADDLEAWRTPRPPALLSQSSVLVCMWFTGNVCALPLLSEYAFRDVRLDPIDLALGREALQTHQSTLISSARLNHATSPVRDGSA